MVVLGDDAIARLAEHARDEGWTSALLVMDPNTEEAAGGAVAEALAGAGVEPGAFRFPERSGLTATAENAEAVRARLRRDRPDALLAVGSGVLTDITRWAGHLENRDFVSVPTAASMDGYASSVAAMQLDGVKVTYPARAPEAIFADARVVAAAPVEMARSGLGDLMAKASARTDWLAAHLLLGEPFDGDVVERVRMPLERSAAGVEEILRGEPSAVRGLARGLIESGVAMAIVGSSRPASGCEHHASHFWDLLAARRLRRAAPHGLQVGYATRFAIRLQRFAFGGGIGSVARPLRWEPFGAEARAWLGDPSPEIVAAAEDKRRFIAAGLPRWPPDAERWEVVRTALAPALAAHPAVERALEKAGIPGAPGFADVDSRTLAATFRYANRLRARYTTLDFLEGQGMLDEALEATLGAPTSDRGRARG